MNNKEKNVVLPAVFLMIRKNDEVLLMRRFNTGFQDGQYTLPSGHVEKNEPPTLAACREAKEEVGVEVKPQDIRCEQVLYRRGYNITGAGFDPTQTERVDFFFSTNTWQGEPSVCEPDNCDYVGWFPLTEVPENTFPVVRKFLQTYPHHSYYEEAGYEE